MSIEQDAYGRFSPEEPANVLVPCALAATTFEIYDSFKQILRSTESRQGIEFKNKPLKIKLFEVLASLVSSKPEFILGMGRFTDDILPVIKLMLKKQELDSLETKLKHQMETFISACKDAYALLDKID